MTPSPQKISTGIVHSILERGTDSDVRRLIDRIVEAPTSPDAETIVSAAKTSQVYGYPALIAAVHAKACELSMECAP